MVAVRDTTAVLTPVTPPGLGACQLAEIVLQIAEVTAQKQAKARGGRQMPGTVEAVGKFVYSHSRAAGSEWLGSKPPAQQRRISTRRSRQTPVAAERGARFRTSGRHPVGVQVRKRSCETALHVTESGGS
jgi:hypothetical protein